MLHGVQASLLPEDHPGHQVCAPLRALHGHPLRASLRVQASACEGLLLLPEQLRLRRWLRRRRSGQHWLRLRQLVSERGLLPAYRKRGWSTETHSGSARMSRPAFFWSSAFASRSNWDAIPARANSIAVIGHAKLVFLFKAGSVLRAHSNFGSWHLVT